MDLLFLSVFFFFLPFFWLTSSSSSSSDVVMMWLFVDDMHYRLRLLLDEWLFGNGNDTNLYGEEEWQELELELFAEDRDDEEVEVVAAYDYCYY